MTTDPSSARAGTIKRVLVGKPIATDEADHQRLTKRIGLAVFSSDAQVADRSNTADADEHQHDLARGVRGRAGRVQLPTKPRRRSLASRQAKADGSTDAPSRAGAVRPLSRRPPRSRVEPWC